MKFQNFLFVALALFLFGFIFLFNRMVALKKRAQGAWADVDVQLKRRHDLIPSLVTCVQGYISHEKGTLLEVTKSRQEAQSQTGVTQRAQSEGTLTERLKSLVLLAENYPDLKANSTFLSLQEKLTDTEDAIQHARRYYNAVIRDFNTLISQFPGVLIARLTGFKSLEFFELESHEEAGVSKVSLTGDDPK